MAFKPYWSRQRAADRPFQHGDTLNHGGITQSEVTRKVLDGACQPIMCIQDHPSLIDALRSPTGPAAVLWRIAEIIIDAVDGVFRRGARPHIGIEVLEGIQPSLADRDAHRAIFREPCRRFSRTAVDGVSPDSIFPALRQAMRHAPRAQLLFSQAPARPRTAVRHIKAAHEFLSPAVTATAVMRMFRIALGLAVGYDDQPMESLTGLKTGHSGMIPYFVLTLKRIA